MRQECRVCSLLTVLADFLREFRELEPDRRVVLRELPSIETEPLSELPESLRVPATRVCWYLDALSLLVYQGLVDEDAPFTIIASPVKRLWVALEPFIDAERSARGLEAAYMRGFEDLAARARVFDHEHALDKLQRFQDVADSF